MDRDAKFMNLFSHAAYCAGQVSAAAIHCISKVDADAACPLDRAIVQMVAKWGGALEKSLAGLPETQTLVGLASSPKKPTGSVRNAEEIYCRLSEEKQSALCAMVADPVIKWCVLRKLTSLSALESATPSPELELGINAFEQVIGLHCLICGDTVERALSTYRAIAETLIQAALPKDNAHGADSAYTVQRS